MEKTSKIYVAGHRGMVGSAILRELQRQGYTNIITRTHKELDLCRQEAVEKFFAEEKPEYVFLAAAKVGGIVANQSALADFMYENMILEMNVIHSAWQNGCKKLEFHNYVARQITFFHRFLLAINAKVVSPLCGPVCSGVCYYRSNFLLSS